METIQDNPLTCAAKEQAAREALQRKVPAGFNETTLSRAAQVLTPSTIEFALIRSAAKVSEAAFKLTGHLIDLTDNAPVPEDLLLTSLNKLSAALPELLLNIDLVRSLVIAANDHNEAAKIDRGGLQAFFGGYMAAANELERRTRSLEAAHGQPLPPIDPDAPTYTKYEILELAARMATEEKKRSGNHG